MAIDPGDECYEEIRQQRLDRTPGLGGGDHDSTRIEDMYPGAPHWFVAQMKEVREMPTLHPVSRGRSDGTTFVTSETGGTKGQKDAQFSRIPFDVLTELAIHFGRGAEKYPNDPITNEANWQKGYGWNLNIDALMRHLALWVEGEETDEETGSSHLIAVVWHAMVLRWFQIHGRGTDTRTHV